MLFNAMQSNAKQCNAIMSRAMHAKFCANAMPMEYHSNAILINAKQCNAKKCHAMLNNAMLFNAKQCNESQCNAKQCNAKHCYIENIWFSTSGQYRIH